MNHDMTHELGRSLRPFSNVPIGVYRMKNR